MTESFKESLIDARERAPSAVTTFMQSPTEDSTIIAFVEGPDDTAFYYADLLDDQGDGDVLFIECYSKAGVLRAQDFLRRRRLTKPCKAVYFFCDSDFDGYLDRPNQSGVFYTAHYSVESYLVDDGFFEYVLGRHCGFTRKKVRSELASELFARVADASASFVLLFAAMCRARSHGGQADFDRLPLTCFVEFDPETKHIRGITGAGQILRKLDLGPEEEAEINRLVEAMSGDDFRNWFRGKHAWQLVNLICEREFASRVPRTFKNFLSVVGLREFHHHCPSLEHLSEYLASIDRMSAT